MVPKTGEKGKKGKKGKKGGKGGIYLPPPLLTKEGYVPSPL